MLPKSPYTEIRQSSLEYSPSDRILNLAKPKIKRDNTIRKGLKFIIILFCEIFEIIKKYKIFYYFKDKLEKNSFQRVYRNRFFN
jgi:hypothetical protein